MKYRDLFSLRNTPQSQAIPGTIANSAGGYSFPVDDWTRLDRFLILGSENGTYYASPRKLTVENAEAVLRCIAADGQRAVNRIADISDSGRAAKNDPAIFALAMCTAHPASRNAALAALPRVARTGTHLFQFATAVEGFRGWGRGLRRAISSWYLTPPLDRLALSAVKYQQREGWSHRDMLRLSHPVAAADDSGRRAVFDWICRGTESELLPSLIQGTIEIRAAISASEAAVIIRNRRLPREIVPTEYLNAPEVWDALLADMPVLAMIRNLAKMTAIGLITPGSAATRHIQSVLSNAQTLRSARLHPVHALLALATYREGKGLRGKLTWKPVTEVIDALDAAFYLSFQQVKPTGKRLMLALDVSGSMWGSQIADSGLTAAAGSAAMAMITARCEANYEIVAFSDNRRRSGVWAEIDSLDPVNISPRQRLDDVLNVTRELSVNMGGTDCALPMLHALKNKRMIDTFIIYTDNETWAGKIHPVQALQKYRNTTGIQAKLAVVGMCSNGFSIADPNDGGMLDVVGFDTAAPQLISAFAAGELGALPDEPAPGEDS